MDEFAAAQAVTDLQNAIPGFDSGQLATVAAAIKNGGSLEGSGDTFCMLLKGKDATCS